MSISIYNTLTRKTEEFKPIKSGEVRMYVCGVTVYDECHLGHARSAFVFDVIRRYLKYRGYKVIFVRNITDVDDKIIDKARQEIKDVRSSVSGLNFNEAVKAVSERYIKSFYEDMAILGIERADIEPKATERIPDMIKMIELLISKGYAYVSGGDVYFEVRKFEAYGRLSNQNLDQMLAGTRVEVGENKTDRLDFALWKAAKENEPAWPSPWGAGRPGWHIECSAMSTKELGANFDIHGGGRDLIFPHHENEIAQSEAATESHFANYWIHNGLLTINGEKMAKSLGNYVSIKDVVKRYSPDVLKLFFLGTHYSHPIDFSWERMEAAKSAYDRFTILFNKIDRETTGRDDISSISSGAGGDILKLQQQFESAMDENFNTPVALSVLFELVSVCNKGLEDKAQDVRYSVLKYGFETLRKLGQVLGLSFNISKTELSDLNVETEIASRDKLRKEGKFKEADNIREELAKKGIVLEDVKGKTYWRRKA